MLEVSHVSSPAAPNLSQRCYFFLESASVNQGQASINPMPEMPLEVAPPASDSIEDPVEERGYEDHGYCVRCQITRAIKGDCLCRECVHMFERDR